VNSFLAYCRNVDNCTYTILTGISSYRCFLLLSIFIDYIENLPTISAIAPNNGTSGTIITISGDQLSPSSMNGTVSVVIGNTASTVLQSSSNVIVCRVGDAESGIWNVTVLIDNIGQAVSTSDSSFTFVPRIYTFMIHDILTTVRNYLSITGSLWQRW